MKFWGANIWLSHEGTPPMCVPMPRTTSCSAEHGHIRATIMFVRQTQSNARNMRSCHSWRHLNSRHLRFTVHSKGRGFGADAGRMSPDKQCFYGAISSQGQKYQIRVCCIPMILSRTAYVIGVHSICAGERYITSHRLLRAVSIHDKYFARSLGPISPLSRQCRTLKRQLDHKHIFSNI